MHMKAKGILPYLLLIILALVTFYKNAQQSKQIELLQAEISESKATKTAIPEPEFELATAMGKLQYFSNKLYYSLKSNNKSLADFYIHEMEESFEAIEDANIVEDGIAISDNVKAYGIKGLENFERFLEQSPERFEEHYLNLVNACNSCHLVSKHGFIEITVPSSPVVSNQNFSH